MRVQSDKAHTWNTSNKKGENKNRIVVSFQCDKDLWFEFDNFMTERYGNYKKSILIESLIKKYMKQKTRTLSDQLDESAFIFRPQNDYDYSNSNNNITSAN